MIKCMYVEWEVFAIISLYSRTHAHTHGTAAKKTMANVPK